VSKLSMNNPAVMSSALATQIPSNYDEWLKIWAA
jgi:hypothetical protein